MDRLLRILEVLEAGAHTAETILPDGSTPDDAARAGELLFRIAGAALRAHTKVTGEPVDLSKLHRLQTL